MTNKLTSNFILIFGISILGFGLAYLFSLVTMIEHSGMKIPTPSAKADALAMYAGIQVGFGLFMITCSRRVNLLPAGLLSIVFIFGGIAIGRTLGIVYYASIDLFNVLGLLIEWPAVLIAFWLYRRN